jgi:hypothetical protein
LDWEQLYQTLDDLVGNTFSQQGTNATGNLVGVAGSATRHSLNYQTRVLVILHAVSGSHTFSGVNLVTVTGNGRGATADITIVNGSIVASGATISNNGGSGYQVGDVLGITTIGIATVGTNARLTIAGIELLMN